MKDLFIIKVLDKMYDNLPPEQIEKLKYILEEELNNYELQTISTDLILCNTIQDKILLFLASKKLDGRAKTTIESYGRYLRLFNNFIHKDINNINTFDIRTFLAVYSKTDIKNTTLATKISILKSFFSWLENEELINKNPMKKIPTTKIEKHIRKPLTSEELEMLRIACKTKRDQSLVEVFYSTGARLDEVFKLNKDDINWSDGSILVVGKGNKERIVLLNAKAKIYLHRYLNSRVDNNEALFVVDKKPYGRLGKRSIEKIFNKLGKLAGIINPVYPHIARHTLATNMLNNGGSLIEVQKYLGHDNPSTTQIYAQLSMDAVKLAHKKICNIV
jgi:integrase/recombinase XerD